MTRFLSALIIAFLINLPLQADESRELRVSNYLPSMAVAVRGVMEPWLDDLEQQSDGTLTFRRFWGGSLGRGPFRQYLLVKEGIVDITYLFLPMHAGRFPEAEVLEMPLLFETAEQASAIGWRLFEEGLMQGFEDVKVLGIFTTAPGRLFTKPKLRSLEGYGGLKLRAAGPLQASYVTALGATPEIIDAATATDALRRGTIDGLIQGWSGMAIFKQTDVTDYFFDIPVGMLPFAVVMNKSTWDTLSKDQQEIFSNLSGPHLSRRGGQAYDQAASRFREKFLSENQLSIENLTPESRSEIRAKVDDVERLWAGQDSSRAAALKRVYELKRSSDGEF